jgi:hypothetical protein
MGVITASRPKKQVFAARLRRSLGTLGQTLSDDDLDYLCWFAARSKDVPLLPFGFESKQPQKQRQRTRASAPHTKA